MIGKHGITQRELERRTDGEVTQADVSRILAGGTKDPGFGKIAAIADALGEPLEEFRRPRPDSKRWDVSFKEFKRSEFAKDATEDELAELKRTARWPWGPPTMKAWYHALEQMRATRRGS